MTSKKTTDLVLDLLIQIGIAVIIGLVVVALLNIFLLSGGATSTYPTPELTPWQMVTAPFEFIIGYIFEPLHAPYPPPRHGFHIF